MGRKFAAIQSVLIDHYRKQVSCAKRAVTRLACELGFTRKPAGAEVSIVAWAFARLSDADVVAEACAVAAARGKAKRAKAAPSAETSEETSTSTQEAAPTAPVMMPETP